MKWKRPTLSSAPNSKVIRGLGILVGVLGVMFLGSSSWSAGFKSPEECLAYSGAAHLNCLYAYIEIQQDKISKLEKELRGQQERTRELHDRLKQQNLQTQALKNKIEDRLDRSHGSSFPVIRSYAGFYYRFGSPYYYDPYFGPPFGYSYGMYYPLW